LSIATPVTFTASKGAFTEGSKRFHTRQH